MNGDVGSRSGAGQRLCNHSLRRLLAIDSARGARLPALTPAAFASFAARSIGRVHPLGRLRSARRPALLAASVGTRRPLLGPGLATLVRFAGTCGTRAPFAEGAIAAFRLTASPSTTGSARGAAALPGVWSP